MITANDLVSAAAAVGCDAGVCAFSAVQAELLPCRAAARLPQQAASVLCVLFPYRMAEQKPGNLSRYAAVPDYHLTAGRVLTSLVESLRQADPDGAYEGFLDNSPIPEVQAAVAAGLGIRGDNGLFFSRRFGSYVFIGTVVTNRAVEPAVPTQTECLHCGRCAAACPTGCLPLSGTRLAREQCLSDITQRKGDLTPAQEELLRRTHTAWGCDICQEICPLNRQAEIAPHPCFSSYQQELTPDDLHDLSGKAYGWRGRAVLQRNLNILASLEEKSE